MCYSRKAKQRVARIMRVYNKSGVLVRIYHHAYTCTGTYLKSSAQIRVKHAMYTKVYIALHGQYWDSHSMQRYTIPHQTKYCQHWMEI